MRTVGEKAKLVDLVFKARSWELIFCYKAGIAFG